MQNENYVYITVDDTTPTHTIEFFDPQYTKDMTAWEVKEVIGFKSHLKVRYRPEGKHVLAVSRIHLDKLIKAYEGNNVVYVEHVTKEVNKCDKRCVEAQGDDCECACLGLGHGSWDHSWTFLEVGETTLIESLTYRIITRHEKGMKHLWDEETGLWWEANAENLGIIYHNQRQAQSFGHRDAA